MYTKDQNQETFVRNNTSEMEIVIWDDFRGKKGLNRRSNPRARKWINKKAIPESILKFVVNAKASPAKAKGLIKSHKKDNPARLLLSGCNTAIENLSIFVDYHLTPLAKKLPSFIQDSTDFLNKLLELNYKPTASTLLVSFDVVNMFPNIDNNLGIKAVKKAFNSRKK